jgi:hypothetical protein
LKFIVDGHYSFRSKTSMYCQRMPIIRWFGIWMIATWIKPLDLSNVGSLAASHHHPRAHFPKPSSMTLNLLTKMSGRFCALWLMVAPN